MKTNKFYGKIIYGTYDAFYIICKCFQLVNLKGSKSYPSKSEKLN